MNRLKRIGKTLALLLLTYLSLALIFAAPQPLTAIIFVSLLWIAGYFATKYRKHVFGFIEDDIPLKIYIEKQALAKKQELERQQNQHLFTLDALNLKPLTDYENKIWNQTIADFNNKDK